MKTITVLCLVLASIRSFAQVDEIRGASKENSEKRSNRERGGVGFFVFDIFIDIIPGWQAAKLHDNRERYPSMVSLDMMFQGAVKPSSYYVLWPRVRGNWGLFSTDFRMNYLIEDDIDGYKHIRTNDWQILQLNLITSKYLSFRLGTGFMKEAFGEGRSFNESAFMFYVHAPDQSKVIGFEYRFAKDWNTGVNPRREFSAQYQHELFRAGALHGYVTAGFVYQRYYNSIDIWGIQGGLIFRLF
jgi:hypothetical protein